MRSLRFLLFIVGCLGLAWPVQAAEESPLGSGPLTQEQRRQMDANKDGVISKEEYEKLSSDSAAWQQMDADGNGVLDKDEQDRNTRVVPILVR